VEHRVSLDTNNRVERLIDEIGELSPEEKERLIAGIVTESGTRFSMVFGNGHITKADVVIQVNSLPEAYLNQVITAIASRIEKS
jgi:hypothetical protein